MFTLRSAPLFAALLLFTACADNPIGPASITAPDAPADGPVIVLRKSASCNARLSLTLYAKDLEGKPHNIGRWEPFNELHVRVRAKRMFLQYYVVNTTTLDSVYSAIETTGVPDTVEMPCP